MGTSLTTLSLYGAERSSVEPRLAPTDTLRDQNPPWLTVTPDHDEEESYPRLVKLAGALTKEAAAGALVFEYFDDEMFSCLLYRGGKRVASCRSGASWAKLGKALGELLGDDGPVRAFRYVRRCSTLEEQVSLLEETVGAALFDIPEEEPRLVPRSDAVMQAIRSREALLRRRPNAFTLTEVPREEWPEALQLREALLERLRPQWLKYDLEDLLYDMETQHYLVPGSPGLVAYPYRVRDEGKALLFYDGKTGKLWERGPSLNLDRVVGMTGAGEPVILFFFQTVTRFTGNGPARFSGMGYACCLREDGTERWRFAPERDVHQQLWHVHTSDEGVITLFARSINTPSVHADARVWQIDGETGELLRARRFDLANDPVYEMVYAPSPGVFLCSERETGELVVLNERLEETARWDRPILDFSFMSFFGDELCDCLWDLGIVRYFNLRTGQARETKLEISPGYFTPLPDGRILGLNEKANQLTVFDREGLLAARCKVPGKLRGVFPTERGVFLGELRGPDFGGVICGELFAMASTHVWRLDPVLKKPK